MCWQPTVRNVAAPQEQTLLPKECDTEHRMRDATEHREPTLLLRECVTEHRGPTLLLRGCDAEHQELTQLLRKWDTEHRGPTHIGIRCWPRAPLLTAQVTQRV